MMHSLNKMANSILKNVQKPDKWPENERECALQNIFDAMQWFIEEPNYKNDVGYALTEAECRRPVVLFYNSISNLPSLGCPFFAYSYL